VSGWILTEKSDSMTQQSGHHHVFGEVLLHFLVGKIVARVLELFGGPAEIPAFQLVHAQFGAGEVAQFGDVALGERPCLGRQFTQESGDLRGRRRHFRHQRDLRVVVEAQHGGFFGAQLEQARD